MEHEYEVWMSQKSNFFNFKYGKYKKNTEKGGSKTFKKLSRKIKFMKHEFLVWILQKSSFFNFMYEI